MKKHLKTILSIVVLVATVIAFSIYINGHPEVVTQLKTISIAEIAGLVLLYSVWFVALAMTLQVSLRMYKKTMGAQENLLLSAYSSLINFFGLGQSGPALRALYLKKRHNMRIKDYIFATLIYYACYAIISALFLVGGSQPWWLTLPAVIVTGGGCWLVLQWYAKKSQIGEKNITPFLLLCMFVATLLQLITQVVIYFVELHAVSSHISIAQVVTYTGAANFALFVALTPGAIGIREAFLLFTEKLHHIDAETIVAANVADRAVYLVFLGGLFILVLSLHAGKKLKLTQLKAEAESEEVVELAKENTQK